MIDKEMTEYLIGHDLEKLDKDALLYYLGGIRHLYNKMGMLKVNSKGHHVVNLYIDYKMDQISDLINQLIDEFESR